MRLLPWRSSGAPSLRLFCYSLAICGLVVGGTNGAIAQDYESSFNLTETESGAAQLQATIPITSERLEELGIAREITLTDVSRMLRVIRVLNYAEDAHASGEPISFGNNYTCDSATNTCSCNGFIDCDDMMEECGGIISPPGEPGKICRDFQCECTWKAALD